MKMTAAERVYCALNGEKPDKTPFTVYESFFSPMHDIRSLCSRGMCVVKRISSYDIVMKGIDCRSVRYDENGRHFIKNIYSTPLGDLDTLHEVNETSTWLREYLFKSPEDYSKLVYLINSMEAVPNYARAEHAVENCGSDSVIRDGFPLEPLQQLISAHYMSMNDFCLEWYDNRDEVLKLHEAFTALNRTIYPIVAKSPVKFANYGGNVIPQIIGRQVFQEYYMPHYEEAAEIMHKNGKLIGSHFDSDNTPIMDLIADTPLDYIEAYDPGISPPLSEAFKAFGDKIIWINWSSAWHLSSPSQAVEYTRELIRQAQGNPRFLIGITEDIPADRFMPLLSYIMDGIEIES